MKARPYVQVRRADAAAQTATNIIAAATELFLELGDQPTLDAVAKRAGVTVQTVLRRFGSKEGLHEAAIAHGRQRVADGRNTAPVGDIDGAIANLLEHYNEWGDVSLRLLAIEGKSAAAAEATAGGRAFHRAWVERVFAPFLERIPVPERAQRTTELVVATDVYVWKLLHRDTGLSRQETHSTLVDLVRRIFA